MTARLASSSTSWSTSQKREEGSQEIYQKALKLLQDPILPVRAHGLLLLRQLVSSRRGASTPTTDPALVPAIMSIFMQSVQDDDSYIFLNAVQGLSAMADAFGKDVLGNLLETYTCNLSASSVGTLSKQEVDAKVRVGEALGQVIRRCGDALGIYGTSERVNRNMSDDRSNRQRILLFRDLYRFSAQATLQQFSGPLPYHSSPSA